MDRKGIASPAWAALAAKSKAIKSSRRRARSSRGLQSYPILLGYAQRRQTVTYDELADLIGYGNGHFIGNNALGPIMAYCDRKGLPALTSIVVNKETGKLGPGFNDRGRELPDLQNEVFNLPWFHYYPPTEPELQESSCGER